MAHKHDTADTRRRILTAASECFAKHGYDATGVAEICEQAGVTKGAFYHHFESKQEVFLALLEAWRAGLDARLAGVQAERASMPQALHRMIGEAISAFEAARGQVPLFLEFWSKASRDPLVWKGTIAPYRNYRVLLASLIEQGIAEGSLRAVDAQDTADMLLSIALGMLLQGLLDPEGADWVRVAEHSVNMLLEGVLGLEKAKV
jgi:AcrR family transcriptional regulator